MHCYLRKPDVPLLYAVAVLSSCRFFLVGSEQINIYVKTWKGRLFFKIDLVMDFAALCSTDFIDWRYIHSWLVFFTQVVTCFPHGQRNYTCVLLPLYLLSDLPPLPKLNVQYIQTVCGCGGGGVELCCSLIDHIQQEFYTLLLTRFGTYIIASPPQTK